MSDLFEWLTAFLFTNAGWLLAAVIGLACLMLWRRVRHLEDALSFLVETLESSGSGTSVGTSRWNEQLYLAVNPDVAAAVTDKRFASGREHFELAGRAEHRKGGWIPSNWNEEGYLETNPDVAHAVFEGRFLNGYHHYLAAGAAEGRRGGFPGIMAGAEQSSWSSKRSGPLSS